MTPVRSRRSKIVHAWTDHGTRRDLAPESIPLILCGRRLRGAIVVDEEITCAACIDIIWRNN